MKKIMANIAMVVIVIAVIIILLISFGSSEGARYVYKGNTAYVPVEIQPKEYQCSQCNMDVERLSYAVELITKEGNTYFFDDIGCLVLWIEANHPDVHSILTQTQDTQKWIDAKQAYYSRTAASPMGYGFAAYEKKKPSLIGYEEMKLFMLQGKTLHDPFVKKTLLK